MTEQRLMKDGLSKHAVQRISNALKECSPEFNEKAFQKAALKELDQLELKARVQHVIEALHSHLPNDFVHTYKIFKKIPKHWSTPNPEDSLSGFAAWPLIDYIGVYGIQTPEKSLDLLARMTHMFSSEFAIRPFFQNHSQRTLSQALEWTQSDNDHIRRLASEGCRPRLPWGQQLKDFIKDPKPILPILEKLKEDESAYVRKSVANNLNDISKDNPDFAIKTCRKWAKKNHKHTNWIIKHALRTLIKTGDPRVFPLLGFEDKPKVKINNFYLSCKAIKIGDEIQFEFDLIAKNKAQKLVVDYAVHFVKANGTTSAKVFKLKELTLKKEETLLINKKHSFKLITTRKYHVGEHYIAIHVNGTELDRRTFTLS